MSTLKVWFPDFYTEAHRTPDRQRSLVEAFASCGVECRPDRSGCEVALCGSLFRAGVVRRHWPSQLPVVHYNWDLYPWVVANRPEMGWRAYLEDLRRAAVVLVPNEGTAVRTTEMTGRSSVVVHAPVHVWDVPKLPPRGAPRPRSYALDVMRDYSWDGGHAIPERACEELRVRLVRTRTRVPWDEFRWLVANARVLISACHEASTGGLTLLEGHAHGVPVIVTDSPLNGAGEYFGDRAVYFRDLDRSSLRRKLSDEWNHPSDPDPAACRAWVEDRHSDARFAARIAEVLRSCLN